MTWWSIFVAMVLLVISSGCNSGQPGQPDQSSSPQQQGYNQYGPAMPGTYGQQGNYNQYPPAQSNPEIANSLSGNNNQPADPVIGTTGGTSKNNDASDQGTGEDEDQDTGDAGGNDDQGGGGDNDGGGNDPSGDDNGGDDPGNDQGGEDEVTSPDFVNDAPADIGYGVCNQVAPDSNALSWGPYQITCKASADDCVSKTGVRTDLSDVFGDKDLEGNTVNWGELFGCTNGGHCCSLIHACPGGGLPWNDFADICQQVLYYQEQVLGGSPVY